MNNKIIKKLLMVALCIYSHQTYGMETAKKWYKSAVTATFNYMPSYKALVNTFKKGSGVRTRLLVGAGAIVAGALASAKNGKAEHIFYKEDGTELTQEEHEVAYDAMLKNQFPMAPYYNDKYDPKKDETIEIQKQLDVHAPGVKARWIPTTLYEVLLHNYAMNCKEKTEPIKAMHGPGRNLEKEHGLDAFFACNQDADLKKYHKKFNDMACHALDTRTKEEIIQSTVVKKLAQPIVKKSIAWEEENWAQGNKHYPLYRGRGPHGSYMDAFEQDGYEYFSRKKNVWLKYESKDKGHYDNSNSYSNSLFAGLFRSRAENAFYYMQKSRAGYLLPVEKENYIQGRLEEQFFIPPLTTLAGYFSEGQYFHPRTKTVFNKNSKKGYESNITLDQKLNELHLYGWWNVPLPRYLLTIKNSSTECRKLIQDRRKYVLHNAVPLTWKTKKSLHYQKTGEYLPAEEQLQFESFEP